MTAGGGIVALLSVAALAASGCGGDDSNDFRSDYNAVVRQYSSLPVEVGNAVRDAGTKSAKQLDREFGDLADRLSAEVTKLRKLDPPDDAADEFNAFVTGLAKVRDDLRAISDGAKANSASRTTSGAHALVRDSKQVSRDEDALKRAVD